MTPINAAQLQALLDGSTTIEADGLGLKVARLGDGSFLKLYRRKRLISSALWSPPARRFADNAAHLTRLGIAAPEILDLLLIGELHLNGVRYQPLPGETLRNRWRTLEASVREREVEAFGRFLAGLHESGVYFRSLHLGNVLHLPDGRLGLIDLSDMRIDKGPLNRFKRSRNLKHILRYREDSGWLLDEHRTAWLRGYTAGSGSAAGKLIGHKLETINRKRQAS
ncbi:phosphotransferase [Pseudomonas sp. LRF_L74]|uniref:phosphotransferase n=1 Tax=Pseudomonas sp. LRF_L74 TaxID=3369422 RepID=UPI003F611C1F